MSEPMSGEDLLNISLFVIIAFDIYSRNILQIWGIHRTNPVTEILIPPPQRDRRSTNWKDPKSTPNISFISGDNDQYVFVQRATFTSRFHRTLFRYHSDSGATLRHPGSPTIAERWGRVFAKFPKKPSGISGGELWDDAMEPLVCLEKRREEPRSNLMMMR
ncbi:hypothetical protein NPIL_377351 [Nephila pilipes]|uniref:Uncharacterized protein n=1 Tax=Nephila pilipes TaxID=299642 RepID=A0A8X6QBJ3_NEPPI|nr:hypothetical protein NPIL_377351 [Nephila pilipes]